MFFFRKETEAQENMGKNHGVKSVEVSYIVDVFIALGCLLNCFLYFFLKNELK